MRWQMNSGFCLSGHARVANQTAISPVYFPVPVSSGRKLIP